ncbi:hypothetical protein QBC32DRAFT_229132 [Pseudoneurospora amorphoporcata]|uniref:Uncharacterized protein n=1 Tax=Pseudoneurospora amorphoporcata TaxID=241081 RepID=A0AAN6P151_9PEZI|nr:hypothetical protein QBC32DRAFT_229132 [Pseudoneurospora amorphoporcata]
MAFWGQVAEWGANTVAPAVVGLAMNAKDLGDQVGGQAAEWAAKEVAPRAVGLAMEAQKHAEQVAEWGAKEVAPRAVGLAMEAQKHAEHVAPAVVGVAMNAKQHAEEISGHVAHWSTHHFVPAAAGLAHNAKRYCEQASPTEREVIIRGLVSVSLTLLAEGFGISLPKSLIKSGRAAVNPLESGVLTTVETSAVVIESIVRLISWLL